MVVAVITHGLTQMPFAIACNCVEREGETMRDLTWRRVLALLMLVMMLQSPVAAQGIGGDAKGGDDEATTTSDIVGPCQATDRSDVTDEEEAGLVGRRSYESPQFGYAVDWTRDWVLDSYFETPVISKTDSEQDMLCLYWSDDDSNYGYVYVIGQTAGRGGPDADVEQWLDEDYIDDLWPDLDVTVLLDDTSRDQGAVVYLLEDPVEGYQYVHMFTAIELDDGNMIYVTFSTAAVSVEVSYPALVDGLELDGKPMISLFDVEDILDEL